VAHVRVELDAALADRVRVTSVVNDEPRDPAAPRKRTTLSEEDLYDELARSIGLESAERVRQFVDDLSNVGIEPVFKGAALMLKVPDPNGEAQGASLLAIERSGRIYNPNHGSNQVRKWGWDEAAIARTIGAYWHRLHELDPRFSVTGISHVRIREFLPLQEMVDKLDAIGEAIKDAVGRIEREAEHAHNAAP
jgi:hypothetical protein